MRETIKIQFGSIAKEYDQQRKKLIPCFDDFYGMQVQCVHESAKRKTILDVGAGTGLLTSFLYENLPESQYTLIDISPEMILQARKRFEGIPNFEFVVNDYVHHNFVQSYDAVVSSLSIHHLEDKEKMDFYRKIHGILNRGGIFVNGDQFISRSAANEDKIQKKWIAGIENSGLSQKEKEQAFERMKMDKPATIENNMKWLEEAGFIDVELMYKYGPFGVICGVKG